MCLLRQLFQSAAAGLDQWVQVRCRPAKDIHRQRIALGLVFHLAQGVNGFQKHLIVVLELPAAVRHFYMQFFKRLGCRACPGCRRLHIVGQLYQTAAQRVRAYIHKLTGVLKLLQLFCGQAGLGGQGQQVICCLAHIYCRFCKCSHQAADNGHRGCTAGREAVQLVNRSLQAGRQTDSQRIG